MHRDQVDTRISFCVNGAMRWLMGCIIESEQAENRHS